MKRSFAILLGATMMAACASKPEATIDGTVTGVEEGTKIYLLDNTRAKLDSTVVAEGKFHFNVAKAYPDQNVLQLDGVRGMFPFFIEPGAIVATIDAATTQGTFAGTPTNDAIVAYKERSADISKRANEIMIKANSAEPGPAQDSLVEAYYALADESEEHRKSTILAQPATVLASYLLMGGASGLSTPAMVDSVLNIVAAAPANAFIDRLKERRDILATTAVGQPAPDFSQAQADGTPFSLSSLKGKLVLIDFWASWCGPCRRENPNVVAVYNKYHDKGFEILGVSLDDNRDAWLKAIEDDGLVWNHVSDLKGWGNVVAEQYGVKSIPHTVLVGTDGVIIAKNLRGEALEAKIAEVLGQ
jgi:peroxiredoxin